MAINSKIQWTGATWNPFVGCEKVSQGCKFCYAERFVEGRFGRKFRDVQPTKNPTFYFPLKYSKTFDGSEPFYERLVFTCSLSDFFIEQIDELRPLLWDIINHTPNLIYQILTKRPERVLQNLPPDWGAGYPNVWLGTSTEDQKTFDERVPILSQIPATIRFLSIEPILGPIVDKESFKSVDWVIIGGESGTKGKFRPASFTWFDSIVSSCLESEVPVFVKQLGTHLANEIGSKDFHGGHIEEFPERLRVRQWPKKYL
jgi:protein gp37